MGEKCERTNERMVDKKRTTKEREKTRKSVAAYDSSVDASIVAMNHVEE